MSTEEIDPLIIRFAKSLAAAPADQPTALTLREVVREAAKDHALNDFFKLECEAKKCFGVEEFEPLKERLTGELITVRAAFATLMGRTASPVLSAAELTEFVGFASEAHQHAFDRLMATGHGWGTA